MPIGVHAIGAGRGGGAVGGDDGLHDGAGQEGVGVSRGRHDVFVIVELEGGDQRCDGRRFVDKTLTTTEVRRIPGLGVRGQQKAGHVWHFAVPLARRGESVAHRANQTVGATVGLE